MPVTGCQVKNCPMKKSWQGIMAWQEQRLIVPCVKLQKKDISSAAAKQVRLSLIHPVRRAVVKIPIIRHEVEASGKAYRYKLLEQNIKNPPAKIGTQSCLYVRALHYTDDTPHALEERWVNQHIVPDILDADLNKISANEWLVLNTPFSSGRVGFSAANATDEQAKLLGLQPDEAVFIVNRDTWQDGAFITNAQIIYTSSYRVESYL